MSTPTSSVPLPQVNQEIYSEEDLLAIDSSINEEFIDQVAVESDNDIAVAVLPPPSFIPTGKIQTGLK